MRIFGLLLFCLRLSLLAMAAQDEATLRRQLAENNRQITNNERLMWDAAFGTVKEYESVATARGDAASARRVIRLAEIGRELRSAAARDDAIAAAKLIAEGGRLIALEGLTRTSDIAKATAGAVGSALSLRDIGSAAIEFGRFVPAAVEHRRLLLCKADLERQFADLPLIVSSQQESSRPVSKKAIPRPEQSSGPDLAELDDALTLVRFYETKDWTIEDRENMRRIAAKYPDIARDYHAALEREARRRNEEIVRQETLGSRAKPRRSIQQCNTESSACWKRCFGALEQAKSGTIGADLAALKAANDCLDGCIRDEKACSAAAKQGR